MKLIIILIIAQIFAQLEVNCSKNELNKAEKVFMKGFKVMREAHVDAVKLLRNYKTYEKQYKMVEVMASSILKVLKEQRAFLESSGYIPGVSVFPENDKLQEGLASVMENTALLSEVILRLPEISTRVMRNYHELEVLFQWGLMFSEENRYLVDVQTVKLFSLVKQELNYTERDPDFYNPYKLLTKHKVQTGNSTGSGKKVKKIILKGPSLSRVEL